MQLAHDGDRLVRGVEALRDLQILRVREREPPEEFTVRGHTVVIKNADTNDCLVNRGLASDLAGTILRVLPLTPGQ